jgi:hypothetical protein
MLIVKPGSNTVSDLEPTDEPLPAIDAEEIEPRFRAVVGRNGERRGIRLERIYWDGLGRMSTSGKMTTADLVQYTAPDAGIRQSRLAPARAQPEMGAAPAGYGRGHFLARQYQRHHPGVAIADDPADAREEGAVLSTMPSCRCCASACR